jgi:hypothetical protein
MLISKDLFKILTAYALRGMHNQMSHEFRYGMIYPYTRLKVQVKAERWYNCANRP